MSNKISFIVLQASVVFNQQLSLFHDDYEDTKEGRNNAFRSLIQKIEDKKVIKISPRITEYILIHKININNDIVYCQLAKRTQMDTFKLSENTIKQESIDSYPPLDVFIDLVHQQFAVEINTKILSTTSIVKTIKNLINSVVKDYSIFFNTIQDKKEFWGLINDKESIQEISFDLVVPNYFGATGAANALVSSAKAELNADSVELSIKNKKGNLNVTLDAIDSYVKYSSSAGAWKLKIKEDGQTKYKTIKSSDCCKKKEIESEIIELIKKMDKNGNIDNDIYASLITNLSGLFEYE